MKQWHVYRVQPDRALRYLGVVAARHQPHAILAAISRWPLEADPAQLSYGFHVTLRPYR